MSLQAIFDAYPPLLLALAGLDDVRFVGPKQWAEQAKPRRIAWKPAGVTHLPPKETGMVLVRQWRVNVEIWGKDLTDTEVLVEKFLAVSHDILSRFSFGTSGSETWDVGGSTADGCKCDLVLLLQSPVLKTQPRSRPITDFIATQTMGDTTV
jgi:hypothetical protein